ncbi:hypothetical protein KKF32_01560 [Patescibacteria group bacterium]|nr:hypothetical protein [Patescibacteria group bacterium]
MSDNNFSQETLELIKEKKIKPEPKWHFLLKNYLVWFFGVISLIIGSLAFSVILYMLVNNDWDIYRNINDSLGGFILVTLPYFWLIFLGLFIFVAHYNIKHTKKGYRLTLFQLIVGIILISILLGTLFYNFGFGRLIDASLTQRLPVYGRFLNQRHRIWDRVEEGRLMGIIVSIENREFFRIMDLNHEEWQINASQAVWRNNLEIKEREMIKMIGRRLNNHNFKAMMVMPTFPLPPFGRGFNPPPPVIRHP